MSNVAAPAGLPPTYLPPTSPVTARFLAVEGVSGAGKTTVVRLLAEKLGASSLHVVPPPFSLTKVVNADLAALPQLAYYLSGLMHAGDLVRETIATTPMITGRYAVSVIANHAAVHRITLAAVLGFAEPLLAYLPAPTVTVYLRTSVPTVRRRMQSKSDVTESDRQLLSVPGLLEQVLVHYDTLIAGEPTGLWVETDEMSPEEIVSYVLHFIEGSRP